jgi:hypothetical protein
VTWCAVCTVHKEMRSAGFLIWPQNQGRQFLPVSPKNRWLRVSRFGPQNQVGYGLLVAPQNQQEDEDGAGHTSRSSGLLHLKVSWARVSQSSLKTGGGMARMVHVASSRWSRGDEAEYGQVDAMGYIGLSIPTLLFSLY